MGGGGEERRKDELEMKQLNCAYQKCITAPAL